MGKGVGIIGDLLDKHVRFVSVLTKRKEREQDTAHPLTLHITYTAFPGKRNIFCRLCRKRAFRKSPGRKPAVSNTTTVLRRKIRIKFC